MGTAGRPTRAICTRTVDARAPAKKNGATKGAIIHASGFSEL